MEKLLNFIITKIVDHPDAVKITAATDSSGGTVFSVTVDARDMGRIIGKGGKIINAVRELVKTAAAAQKQRVKIVLTEPSESTQIDSLSLIESEAPLEDKSGN